MNRSSVRSLVLLVLVAFFSLISFLGVGEEFYINPGAIGFLIGLYPLTKASWDAIKERHLNAEATMLISGIGALFLRQFLAANIIALMAIIMELIESYTIQRGSKDLSELAKSTPSTAVKLNADGSVLTVKTDELKKGDVVIVRQGELIPADGKVVDGDASIVESSLTGESLPVYRTKGDQVFAGTRLIEGYIKVNVDKPAEESYIYSIIREVQENVTKNPPIKRFVDIIAVYFMPLVLVLSFMAYFITGSGVTAISMLVVASPCAVLAATPLAHLATSAKLARRGILIKNGEILRRIANIDTIIFDKTGTITLGKPRVEFVRSFINDDTEKILSLAASCEVASPHPIGNAIIEHARRKGLSLLPISGFRAEIGKGVAAELGDKRYLIGQASWLKENGINLDEDVEELIRMSMCNNGVSVLLAEEKKVIGIIHLEDQLKDDVERAIKEIRNLGIKNIVLLTGDRREVAQEIAKRLNIEFRAELKPEDKLSFVRELKRLGRKIAFVGDGINDALAMTESDVSIAIAPSGSTLASNVAQVISTNERIDSIPVLISLSRKTIGAIYQNIAVFLFVNIVGLVLALFGLITPLSGALIHGLQEMFGFFNSSRLAR